MSKIQIGSPILEAKLFTDKSTILEKVLEHDRLSSPNLHVPHFFIKSLSYIFKHGLNSEGIFRIESNGDTVLNLKKRINEREAVDFEKENVPVSVVASLIKDFLGKSLSEPLLTLAYDETFYSLQVMEDKDNKLKETFLFLFSKLPESNRAIILELLNLLVQIDCNQHVNMMNAESLANALSYDTDMFLRFRKDSPWILKYLIENYIHIFEKNIIKNAKTPFTLRKLTTRNNSIIGMLNLKNNYIMIVHTDGVLHIRDLEYRFINKINLNSKCNLAPLCIINTEIWFALPDSIKILIFTDNNYQQYNEVTIDISNVQAFTEVENTIWLVSSSIFIVDKFSKKIVNTVSLSSKGSHHYIEYVNRKVWYWNDGKYILLNPHDMQIELEFSITSADTPQKLYYDGANIWIGTISGKIIILDANTFEIKSVLSAHKETVNNIMPLGPLIISSAYDRKILCWDPNTLELIGHIPNGHNCPIISTISFWREEKNGWDLWTTSSESIHVLFIPKDFYMYFNTSTRVPDDISARIPAHLLNEVEPMPTEQIENLENYKFKFYDVNQEDSIDVINDEISKLREQVLLKEDEMRKISGFLDKKIQETLNFRSDNLNELRDIIQQNHKKEQSLFLEWGELQVKIAVLHNKYRIRVIEELEKEKNT